VDVNHETELGALLLMASGFFFYVVMESSIVGALLVAGGAWAMCIPRLLRSEESTSY
jgi:hypothetical protein